MTPDKTPDDIARTARSVADEMLDRYLDMGMMTTVPHIERDMAALRIAKVIDAAVKAERERCMKTVAAVCGHTDYGHMISAAIRGTAP